MTILIDTDAFWKLAIAGLLKDATSLLGVEVAECRRLPALPYMLRQGRLYRQLGASACRTVGEVVEKVPSIPQPPDAWLDRLSGVPAIDPGEAQLFAIAAEYRLRLVTGDKRALLALRRLDDFAAALEGRIVTIEALCIALCDQYGVSEIQAKIAPLRTHDKMIAACFSPTNSNPVDCLLSYYKDLARKVAPLALWEPPPGATQ